MLHSLVSDHIEVSLNLIKLSNLLLFSESVGISLGSNLILFLSLKLFSIRYFLHKCVLHHHYLTLLFSCERRVKLLIDFLQIFLQLFDKVVRMSDRVLSLLAHHLLLLAFLLL